MKRPTHTPEETAHGVVELMVLPDGTILSHNLNPAMAALLAVLNPADASMSQRGTPCSPGENPGIATRENPC